MAPSRSPDAEGPPEDTGAPSPKEAPAEPRHLRRAPRPLAVESASAPRSLRPVQKVRTKHGTRVAVRVTCIACGASDTVSFAPRDSDTVLCRKCAFERFGVVDGDEPSMTLRAQPCSICQRTFELRFDPTGQSQPVCTDCRAGIHFREPERTKNAVRLSSGVIRARRTPRSS